MFHKPFLALTLAMSSLLSAPGASAQQVGRIILPVGTGNQTDSNARVLAEALRQVTGQNWIVENRAGAGGSLAANDVARSKPDGLTLLMTTGGHATAAALYKKLPYDSVKDFTPITMLTKSTGFVLLVRSDSPYKTAKDFLDAARAQPGKVSFGSFGVGNTTHVVGALLAKGAGVDLLHVPYKSPVTDFLGGHVDAIFVGESIAQPLMQDGKVRALAISASTRSPTLPSVPTFNELGVSDADVPAWSGILGPAGIPPQQVDALYKAFVKASESKVFQDNAKAIKSIVVLMPPAEFAKTLESQVAQFKRQLPPLGIQLD
jgi:tripartite-type tricarboxylate transporter receptor subunit TctC